MKKFHALLAMPAFAMAGNLSVTGLVGYGLPLPGQAYDDDYVSNTVDGSTSREILIGTANGGVRAGVEVGWALNEFVVVGLGGRWEQSAKLESSSKYTTSTSYETVEYTRQSTTLALLPTCKFVLPGERVRPYARVNAYMGFPTEVRTSKSNERTGTSTTLVEEESEYTGGAAWGFGGGLGLEYGLAPNLALVAEVVSEHRTWAPTEGKLTRQDVNGVSQLADLDVAQKKVKFVDSYTTSSSTPTDPDAPRKSLRSPVAASALSLNLGLQYAF